jgi:hypothetical protein
MSDVKEILGLNVSKSKALSSSFPSFDKTSPPKAPKAKKPG